MNAAAAKVAALNISDIVSTEVTKGSVEAAVKSAIETAVAGTGITVAVNAGSPTLAENTKESVTVYYSLYLDGADAVVGQTKTLNVTHLYTEAELKAKVDALIGQEASVSTWSNWEALKAAVSASVSSIVDPTTGNAVAVTLTTDNTRYEAGELLNVTYTVTYNGQVVTGTDSITLVR